MKTNKYKKYYRKQQVDKLAKQWLTGDNEMKDMIRKELCNNNNMLFDEVMIKALDMMKE